MNIDKISAGDNLPEEINVIVEIPQGVDPVKYEVDKDSGALFVDRIMHTSMRYPTNYGFVPHTLSNDGDPADVLVVSTCPFIAGSVVPCRPVGVLMMEDQSGEDEKIIAVPTNSIFPSDVKDLNDVPEILRQQIEHFFTHYKDLEKGKWVKIGGWHGKDKACELLKEAYDRAQSKDKVA